MPGAANTDNEVFNRPGWWDKNGEYQLLHAVNPLRLRALTETTGGIAGKHLADIGCGGGIFAESAAKAGAIVTAIDTNANAINEAKNNSTTTATYQQQTAAQLPPDTFDIAVCFEVLEHCDNPAKIIADIAKALKPGGWTALSTINRTKRASLAMITLMENILQTIPRGTHNPEQFIKPEELAQYCNAAGLTVRSIKGMHYSFFGKHFHLTNTPHPINYFLFARREE